MAKKFVEKISSSFRENIKKYSIFLYPIFSGVFLALSYDYHPIWFLSLIALIPLFIFFYQVEKNKNFIAGLVIFGIIFLGMTYGWLLKVDVYTWSGVSDYWISRAMIVGYWLFFVFSVGAPIFLGAGWIFSKIITGTWRDVFLFPFLWVVMEYARVIFYSLIYSSPQLISGPHQTFGHLGYVLASSYNLSQSARFGGVYLLSFVVVFINFLLYWIFFRNFEKNKKLKFILISIFFIWAIFPLNILKNKSHNRDEGIKTSVLQTKNESFFLTTNEEIRKKNKIYEKLLSEIERDAPDSEIIILPEDTRFTQMLIEDRKMKDYYKNIFSDEEKIIIDSSRIRDEKNETKLRLYYYDVKNNLMDKYDKILLTPGGEYLPSSFMLIAKLIGFGDWAEKTNDGKYTKGSEIGIGELSDKKIGGLFCFEIVSPIISREMAAQGAEFFVNPASHSSFRGNGILYHQVTNITKIRAVENGRYFIQAGNYIPSSIITDKGIMISNEKEGDSVFTEKVFLRNKKTFYTKFGDWFVGLSFASISIFILIKIKIIKKK